METPFKIMVILRDCKTAVFFLRDPPSTTAEQTSIPWGSQWRPCSSLADHSGNPATPRKNPRDQQTEQFSVLWREPSGLASLQNWCGKVLCVGQSERYIIQYDTNVDDDDDDICMISVRQISILLNTYYWLFDLIYSCFLPDKNFFTM